MWKYILIDKYLENECITRYVPVYDMVYSSLTLQQIYILASQYFSPFFLVLFYTYYIRAHTITDLVL